jgi:hypothetical protein
VTRQRRALSETGELHEELEKEKEKLNRHAEKALRTAFPHPDEAFMAQNPQG